MAARFNYISFGDRDSQTQHRTHNEHQANLMPKILKANQPQKKHVLTQID